MIPFTRRAVVVAATVSLAVGLGACGEAGEPSSSDGTGPRIGILLPETDAPRYELQDKPLLESAIKKRCSNCTIEYANAHGDVATQQQQVDTMLTKGIDVLLFDAVDGSIRGPAERARDADVPVVAYDRLVQAPVAAYVSFSGEQTGRLQGAELLKAMGDKAGSGRIVMINGDPHEYPTPQMRGTEAVLKGKAEIAKVYYSDGWRPDLAHANMAAAIASVGAGNIEGVVAANDALAGGAVAALRAGHVTPLPPVLGQDADLRAVQRIVDGEQYMTVYKPFHREADVAAELAVALARDQSIAHITRGTETETRLKVPSVLLSPVALTVRNIKDTVVRDGVYTIGQICTPKYRAACDKAGLTE